MSIRPHSILRLALLVAASLPFLVSADVRSALAQAGCTGVAPVAGATLSSFPVVTGLTGRPLLVTAPPGDRDRLFIVEQNGFIRIHHRGAATNAVLTFLDLSGVVQASATFNEMGLLGLAFDPNYATNGFFYVNYTEGAISGPWFTVVARYSVTPGGPDSADPGSEERLLRFQQPDTNHNGGQVAFGTDGFLYIATGDGGGGGDIHGACGNGQNRTNLLGKMLRIDVRGVDPQGVAPDCGGASANYTIPSSNPFALTATTECGEIWAFGLRNPWRSAFDTLTGDLYIADVGQNCWEEVNFLPAATPPGANFGWRSMEATHCFDPSQQSNCSPSPVFCLGATPCNDPTLKLPVVEYSHSQGCSITGGVLYRGCQMPDLRGTYFYGDFCSGFVRSFRMSGGVATEQLDRTAAIDPGASLGLRLTSFGSDADGEMYVVNRDGVILRVAPRFADLEVSGAGAATPLLLSPAAWTWENLSLSSMRPVSFYRVYRGTPGGVFRCRFTTAQQQWPGGDPDTPAVNALFAYTVTAVGPSGEETRPGIQGSSFLLDSCP